ncbi:MAG: hypothetical protein GF332_00390 [Candidatus Moranbacteria bacterium]|nr:hypothetical protein [Candidatus Moranbacteria bacterium]
MLLYLKPLIFSVLFIIGFEALIYYQQQTTWILEALLIVVLIASWQISGRLKIPFLPVLFFIGAALLAFYVDQALIKQIYIFSSGLVFYFILYSVYVLNRRPQSEFCKKITLISSIITLFLLVAGVFAVWLNQIVAIWQILTAIFIITGLISIQLLRKILPTNTKINIYLLSLILAYSLTTISWAVFFLPFSYLTASIIISATYFMFVNYLIQVYLKTSGKISFIVDCIIYVLSIAVVLYTAKWSLVINPDSIFNVTGLE